MHSGGKVNRCSPGDLTNDGAVAELQTANAQVVREMVQPVKAFSKRRAIGIHNIE